MNDRAYDVANAFERRLRAIFFPPDSRDTVEFLEATQQEIPYSPIRGPFRISNSPWLGDPLRACADPSVRLVAMLAAVQMAKSQAIELAMADTIVRDPGPFIGYQDKDENADDWFRTRLKPLWDNNTALKGLYPQDERKRAGNTIQFDAMTLWILGALNMRNLQRRTAKYVYGDEVWQWKKGNLKEALARLTAYKGFGKAVLASQGGFEGDDWHEKWGETTQRDWAYHCPKCGMPQTFNRKFLEFRGARRTDDTWDFSKLATETHKKCENPSCSECIPDTEGSRLAMNSSGIYLLQNPDHRPHYEGYRWNKMAGHPWAGIAEDIIRAGAAAARGNDLPRQQVAQKVWAEFWSYAPEEDNRSKLVSEYSGADDWEEEASVVNGKAVSAQNFRDKAWPSGKAMSPEEIATRIPLRVMTCDAQRNGFYVVIRSWAKDAAGTSRKRFETEAKSWEDLDAIAERFGIHRTMVGVDCGDADDDFWKAMRLRRWKAIRGDQRTDFAHIIRIRIPGTNKTEVRTVYRPYGPKFRFGNSTHFKVPVYYFSTLIFKDRLNRQRRLLINTVGTDTSAEYLASMESEYRWKNPKTNKHEWKHKESRPNHFWDCETMGYLIPFKLGVFREDALLSKDGKTKEAAPDTSNEEEPDVSGEGEES